MYPSPLPSIQIWGVCCFLQVGPRRHKYFEGVARWTEKGAKETQARICFRAYTEVSFVCLAKKICLRRLAIRIKTYFSWYCFRLFCMSTTLGQKTRARVPSWTLKWRTLYGCLSLLTLFWSVLFCCNFNLYWADLVAVWLTPPTWHFVVWPVFWLWQCRAVMVRWYIVWLVNDNSYCCPIAVDSLLKVLLQLVTTLIHSSFTWAFAFFTALSISLGTFHWSAVE